MNKAERVVGNREQQQKRNRGMAAGKMSARDHRRERDVGRTGNRPAARSRFAGPSATPTRRRSGPAPPFRRRGGERRQRPSRGGQRSAGQRRFEDLLRGERKEEHHADVVDPEMQRVGDGVVAREIDVRPDNRCGRSYEQQQRVVRG